MVSCDKFNMGCDGGFLSLAWSYLYKTGVVSDTCMPYTSGLGTVKACPSTCSSGDAWKKYKCANKAVKSTGVAAIKSDIYANGPVETGFTVYADFMNYESGVYYHVTGRQEGGHAVKIIGWGHDADSGFDYWICANSWNTDWGENGFFRIKQGDCGIDDAAYGCTPAAANEEFF
jgi:cathepsin B